MLNVLIRFQVLVHPAGSNKSSIDCCCMLDWRPQDAMEQNRNGRMAEKLQFWVVARAYAYLCAVSRGLLKVLY